MGIIHCVCNYDKTIQNEWPTMKENVVRVHALYFHWKHATPSCP